MNFSDIYRIIGGNIRYNRELSEFSQGMLAAKVGLTRSAIGKMETGQQRILLDHIWNIAAALNCLPIDLLPPLEDYDD